MLRSNQPQQLVTNFRTLKAHGRCEVTSICFTLQGHLASIGLDSHLRIWDREQLKLIKQKKLPHSYLTSLTKLENQMIIGNGQGELLFFDCKSLETTRKIKVHNDCINDIKISDHIMTASSDGCVSFLDVNTGDILRTMELGFPIKQIQRFRSKFYLAGVRSFEINQQAEFKKCQHTSFFMQKDDQLYGTNHEKGLFCFSKKYNTYIPCQTMLPFYEGILGTSQEVVTFFRTNEGVDRMSIKSQRIGEIQLGDSINCLLTQNNRLFGGSECGNIYEFTINKQECA